MNPEKVPAHERYRFKPFVGSSHSWALSRALSISSNTAVLDIGAGSGALGSSLKEAGFSELYAVEIDPESASHISPIYKSVEPSMTAFSSRKFGLILLLDILEHLVDPDVELSRIVGLLEPGGLMLISVPNIAHWSVRIPLLFGHFKYRERGILDRTHYSFFTRKSILELVRSIPSLQIVETGSSIEPVELVLPEMVWENPVFRSISRLRLKCAECLPGLLAYQHLLMVKKSTA